MFPGVVNVARYLLWRYNIMFLYERGGLAMSDIDNIHAYNKLLHYNYGVA